MVDADRRPLGLALLGVLVAWAHGPALGTGPVGVDLELLAGLSGPGPGALYQVPHTDGRPLAALSLFLSRGLWAADKVWTPQAAMWLRLENLFILALAALGLRAVVHRLVTPWLGEESGRSAASASAVYLLVHPLTVAAVASLHLRGELLALAFGAWGAAVLLRARQEGEPRLLVRALLLAIAAGLSGRWALYLPPLYALVEAASGARHRVRGARVRSISMVFLLTAVCVASEFLLRARFAPPAAQTYQELRLHWFVLPFLLEKIGVLLMPIPLDGLGSVAVPLAVATLVLAAHPAFVAGRSAPRFWGRAAAGWGAALFLALVLDADARVVSFSLEGASALLLATVVLCAGLGLTSTALQDARRRVLPATLALLFALLAHGAAIPLQQQGRAVDGLRAALEEAARDAGFEAPFVVISDLGSRALPADEAVLLSRRLAQGAPREATPVVIVRTPEELGAVWPWWGVDEGFGGRIVIPTRLLDPTSLPARWSILPAPAPGGAPPLVLGELLDVSSVVPSQHTQLVLACEEGAADEVPVLSWETAEGWSGADAGVHVVREGERVAVFDLTDHPAWFLSGGLVRLTGPGPGTFEALLGPWPEPLGELEGEPSLRDQVRWISAGGLRSGVEEPAPSDGLWVQEQWIGEVPVTRVPVQR